MPDLIVAGAGMGGLTAAVHAAQRGATVTLLEKGDRPGGSMLLSSGVIWRYRDFELFRSECPQGEPALQRLIFERFDNDVAWLESLGAPVVGRETGNPMTVGIRFDPHGLTGVLVRQAGEIRLGEPLETLPEGVPVVLATGGFQGNRELVRRHITPEAGALLLRANPWSTGDGLRLGLGRGGCLSSGLDQFYGRNLPAPPAEVPPEGFVDLAQLYAHHATVVGAAGKTYEPKTWSEIDVVQWTARQPGASARYVVNRDALTARVRDRTVGEMIEAARTAGAAVSERDGSFTIEVVAGITTTLGGLQIDERAGVTEGLYACGADVGGISTGGYSSGLAAALIFGRIAAEEALR